MTLKRLIDPLAAAIIVIIVGSTEGYFYPVVRSWTVQKIEVERDADGAPDYINIAGFMHKVRGCKFVGVEVLDAGTGHQLPIVFLDNAGNDTHTRPVGSQAWGPWKINVEKSTPAIEAKVVHDCHPVWTTTTLLGDFPIPTKSRP